MLTCLQQKFAEQTFLSQSQLRNRGVMELRNLEVMSAASRVQ
jgi:hypothetical protein